MVIKSEPIFSVGGAPFNVSVALFLHFITSLVEKDSMISVINRFKISPLKLSFCQYSYKHSNHYFAQGFYTRPNYEGFMFKK